MVVGVALASTVDARGSCLLQDTCQQAQGAQQEVGLHRMLKSCLLGNLLLPTKPLKAPLPTQTALSSEDCVQMQEPVGMLHIQMPLLPSASVISRSLGNTHDQ